MAGKHVFRNHYPFHMDFGAISLLIKVLMVYSIEKESLSSEQKQRRGDFPGGAVVKNPPANAGDTRSSPGPGRSHMPQSNSVCTTTTELVL